SARSADRRATGLDSPSERSSRGASPERASCAGSFWEGVEVAVFSGAFPGCCRGSSMPCARSPQKRLMRGCLASRRRRGRGVDSRDRSIQQLPDGSAFVLVWVETQTVEVVFADLAQDDSEWSVWFRAGVQEITGVDLTEPAGAVPDVILDW